MPFAGCCVPNKSVIRRIKPHCIKQQRWLFFWLFSANIARVLLDNREGLECNKLHYTGGELDPNTLHWFLLSSRPSEWIVFDPVFSDEVVQHLTRAIYCNCQPTSFFLVNVQQPMSCVSVALHLL